MSHHCVYDLVSRAPQAPSGAELAGNGFQVSREYLESLEARIAKLEQRADAPQTGPTSAHLMSPPARHNAMNGSPSPSAAAGPTGIFGLETAQGDPRASDVSFHTLLTTVFPPAEHQHVGLDSTPAELDDMAPLPDSVFADLPTPEQAGPMFDYYFSHTQRLYPYLFAGDMRSRYERLYRERTNKWIMDVALFAMLFLARERIGTRTINEKSVKYWNLAEKILNSRRRHRSLVQVQTLILQALFMQGTDDPAECWHIIGNAVRSAYFLGLHRPDPTAPDFEERKRTWAALCVIDASILFALDRPSCISTQLDVYPRIVVQNGEDPRPCALFGAWFDLVQLVRSYRPPNIDMFSFLHEAPTLPVDSVMSVVEDLEGKVASWENRLPSLLKLQDPLEASSVEAITLSFRIAILRLLVHRPALHLAIRHASVMPLSTRPSRALAHSVALIASTAMTNLQNLQRTMNVDDVTAPWWRLYFCLNSFMPLATILTLAHVDWPSSSGVSIDYVGILETLHSSRSMVAQSVAPFPSGARGLQLVDSILKSPGFALPNGGHDSTDTLAVGPVDGQGDVEVGSGQHLPQHGGSPPQTRTFTRESSPRPFLDWDWLMSTVNLSLPPTTATEPSTSQPWNL